MNAAYLRAANPPPFTILGKPLKRFSMGHELLLQRFGNRFSIESDQTATVNDLVIAVHICSQPYREDFNLDNFSISLRARLFTKLLGAQYIEKAMERLYEYIDAHTEIPEILPVTEGDGFIAGAPTIQAIKVSLMAIGMTSVQALNVSYSLAHWDYYTKAESKGVIQIIDESQQRKDAELAASMEEKLVRLKSMFTAGVPNGA